MAGAVRQPIDVQSLQRYISQNVPEIKLPLDVKQFGFGQSNPTYQLTANNGRKFVMRKKPPGKLLAKTAHKVEREYRIIHSLERTDVPVPKAYCLCEDDSVVGTPFYIMEFLDGRIIEDATMPAVTAKERMEMWHDAIRTLAKLHRINPKDVGLKNYGKPSGFYDRQIATLGMVSDAQSKAVDIETHEAVGKIPHIDRVLAFFRNPKTQPKDRGNLIHGDYKIDNLVFHRTEPRIIGILDWEMSTIGHPLSDLINVISPFLTAAGAPNGQDGFKPDATPGLPTQKQVIEWYAEVAGWDPALDLPWAAAFGMFRSSVIMQGIAARYALRQASSAKAKDYADMVSPFAEFAWTVVQKAKEAAAEKSKL